PRCARHDVEQFTVRPTESTEGKLTLARRSHKLGEIIGSQGPSLSSYVHLDVERLKLGKWVLRPPIIAQEPIAKRLQGPHVMIRSADPKSLANQPFLDAPAVNRTEVVRHALCDRCSASLPKANGVN